MKNNLQIIIKNFNGHIPIDEIKLTHSDSKNKGEYSIYEYKYSNFSKKSKYIYYYIRQKIVKIKFFINIYQIMLNHQVDYLGE